ncbi:MAG: hypothetical protein PHY47_00975 [Lachnospiraceae bacterium]|nr:hypothetical protein [Lachnospiraceae bacterium]
MLKLDKNEIRLKTIFLHFLYLCKTNKERKYINRNGVMPEIENANDNKKGYKTYCLITLRKFLEGIFSSKTYSIVKAKYNDSYTIQLKNRFQEYGTSNIFDYMLYLLLLREWNPSIINYRNIRRIENHGFSFIAATSQRFLRQPATLTYNIDFDLKNQIFTPVAFERLEEELLEQTDLITPIQEKTAIATLITRSLIKMRENNFMKNSALEAEQAVQQNLDRMTEMAVRYRIPKAILEEFTASYTNTMRGSRGLSSGQIFEFVKRTSQHLHERIEVLEFRDFENIAA